MNEILNIKGMNIDFIITAYYAGCPAKINCAPEDAYPEEPSEIEWEIDADQPNAEFIQSALDNDEAMCEDITEMLIQIVENQEPYNPDDEY